MEWIDINETTPFLSDNLDEEVNVIVSAKGYKESLPMKYTARYEGKPHFYWFSIGNVIPFLGVVTHWMYFPNSIQED